MASVWKRLQAKSAVYLPFIDFYLPLIQCLAILSKMYIVSTTFFFTLWPMLLCFLDKKKSFFVGMFPLWIESSCYVAALGTNFVWEFHERKYWSAGVFWSVVNKMLSNKLQKHWKVSFYSATPNKARYFLAPLIGIFPCHISRFVVPWAFNLLWQWKQIRENKTLTSL